MIRDARGRADARRARSCAGGSCRTGPTDPRAVAAKTINARAETRRRAAGLPRRVRAPPLPDRRRRLLRVVGRRPALDHPRRRRAVRVRRAVVDLAPEGRRRASSSRCAAARSSRPPPAGRVAEPARPHAGDPRRRRRGRLARSGARRLGELHALLDAEPRRRRPAPAGQPRRQRRASRRARLPRPAGAGLAVLSAG